MVDLTHFWLEGGILLEFPSSYSPHSHWIWFIMMWNRIFCATLTLWHTCQGASQIWSIILLLDDEVTPPLHHKLDLVHIYDRFSLLVLSCLHNLEGCYTLETIWMSWICPSIEGIFLACVHIYEDLISYLEGWSTTRNFIHMFSWSWREGVT